jgi:hypothetical protein
LETKSPALENSILVSNSNIKAKISYITRNQLDEIGHCDLIVALDFEASSSIQKNRDFLQKLREVSDNVIFSSPVPCFYKNQYAFWPSYWIELGEEVGLSASIDIKNEFWYDNIFTYTQLEGLINFKKKFELMSNKTLPLTDIFHPLHGCGHFQSSGKLHVKISKLLPTNVIIFIKKVMNQKILNNLKNQEFLKLKKSYSDKQIYKSQFQAFGYHPEHGCRHLMVSTPYSDRIKNYILRKLDYSKRQFLKKIFPEKFISKFKGFLLK